MKNSKKYKENKREKNLHWKSEWSLLRSSSTFQTLSVRLTSLLWLSHWFQVFQTSQQTGSAVNTPHFVLFGSAWWFQSPAGVSRSRAGRVSSWNRYPPSDVGSAPLCWSACLSPAAADLSSSSVATSAQRCLCCRLHALTVQT